MSKLWQIRRGTTAENDSYKGSVGEVTMDTTTNGLRVHDNVKTGGNLIDTVVAFQAPDPNDNYKWYRKYSSGWVEQGGKTPTGSHTASVTFGVTMSDSNYVLQVTNGTGGTGWVQISAKSTTGFSAQAFSSDFNSRNVGGTWYVCGMAA